MQLLEAKTVQLQQLQSSTSQQMKLLEERVEQEETTVTALRMELTDKEHEIKASTKAYTEVLGPSRALQG